MYQLTYTVEFEGDVTLDFDRLSDVKQWIKDNRSSYNYSWDDLHIIEVGRTIDVYQLMGEEYE